MVAKQLPQATFRISDNELWESFKAKAKINGTNASAVFWQFAKDYVDGNLDSRIDSPAANVDIESIVNEALNSKIKDLREEFEEHERIYQAQCQKGFELQIATFREEMNEAIATAKKPLLSVMREKVIAA